MDNLTVRDEFYVDAAHLHSFSSASCFSSSSRRDVSYSCGSCGYELNLNSSNRNTAMISSKYGKSMKRGIISFVNIDESRFTQVDEFQCGPYFSKHSWGFVRQKTKLLCRGCGNCIGNAQDDHTLSSLNLSDASDSSPATEVSARRKYRVRIRALQPSSSQQAGNAFDGER